ncbi:MAG: complex I subunit 4 family protein [Solirubrobacterales bacterium]
MGLTLLLILPLVGAAIAACVPTRQVGPVAALTTLVQVGFLIPVLLKFKTSGGLQGVVTEDWIPQLGIHYALGLDGLNVFLIALTVGAWTIATFAASYREWDQPRLFYVLLAVAETGTIGAFLAQDLILFILFFDLLLVPFYMLIGIWGNSADGVDRRAATLKFVIYTLAGSLLMLAAAVGLGVTAASQNGSDLSFLFADLAANTVSSGAQQVIFIGFALALLIKMPIPPLHGWMPDTYKATPLPVLITLSAVVAKLGAFGFLRVVLPLMPDAAQYFQDVMLILAVVGIVYGSVMAFSQDNARLVVGYSSIAQIGFVLLGIFSLDPKGSEGAILQMINHGVVVVGLFLIIGYLAERAGSESLNAMGGMAKKAPLFATMFLIVALATLAMPGSANFVGEVYILFGAFSSVFVYGAIATVGVALSAVYMIRFFQRSMHNREAPEGRSRELNASELGLLAPAVIVILALAVYPQFVVSKIEPAAKEIAGAASATGTPVASAAESTGQAKP